MKHDMLIAEKWNNYKLLLLSIIVGLIVGLIGSVFRLILSYVEHLHTDFFTNPERYENYTWVWMLLLTIISIYLSLILVRTFAKEAAGSGIQEIEGALDEKRPIRWKRIIPVKFVASLFSLSSGLLLGREGPTVQIGASVGKMIKDIFKQSDEENNPLISAGSAAGLASAFNAPLSGVMFVIEEMHGHFKFNFYSVASIMLGAATADLIVRLLVGANVVIDMTIFSFSKLEGLWLFVLLGGIFGLIGYVFNKLLVRTLIFLKKMKIKAIWIAIVLGVIIVGIGLFYPSFIGTDYTIIYHVFDKNFSIKFLILMFVVRMILSIVSYGSGVPGGIFAPMLILGIIVGMVFGLLGQIIFPNLVDQPIVFAIAGMAAIFASTVKAPITGLMLSVEMTANYELILPLIITTVFASVSASVLGNKPIYSVLLELTLKEAKQKGE